MIQEKNIFFNSSLPRATSTLFQNILAQNTTIHATPTDGSLELLFGARANYTTSPEFKAQDAELMLKAWRSFCYWGLQGYCNGLTDRPNVCIKSRGIGIHYRWYASFFGAQQPVRIVCMVRDLRQIYSSMEKIFRLNQEQHQPIQDHAKMSGTSTAKRIDVWTNSQPIGLALERLKQVIDEGLDKNILFVRSEDLCAKPAETMEKVYAYLNLPVFAHDFDNVEQKTKEDDAVYGLTPNLHTIRTEVAPLRKDYLDVLGKDISLWIDKNFAWYQTRFKYI